MTSNMMKTVLFASLIATMILPFGMMEPAYADRIPPFVEYKEVKIVMTDERRSLLEKVQSIGERINKANSEDTKQEITSELDPLKSDMKRLGLTPTFDFGEDVEAWNDSIEGTQLVRVTSDTIRTGSSHNDNWHIKHQLVWGCNPLVYCTDNWVEWYDLLDWSAITITMPTMYQSYLQLKHLVTNFNGSSETETMNAWGTHTRGLTVLDDEHDSDTHFWLDHEVETETILTSSNVQTGDRVYSTSRIT